MQLAQAIKLPGSLHGCYPHYRLMPAWVDNIPQEQQQSFKDEVLECGVH
jgi:hypothetical protein